MGDITLITRRNVINMTRPQYVLQLRPRATIDTGGGGGGVSSWNDLTDKPSVFPPSAHSHDTDDVTGLSDALAEKQDLSERDQPNGYAGLDAEGGLSGSVRAKIPFTKFVSGDPEDFPPNAYIQAYETPLIFFGATEVTYASWFTDGVTPYYEIAAVEPRGSVLQASIATKQDLSEKDQPDGYAGLDGDGKINPSQLPAIAITDRFVVNSEVAMLALTAETGDIAVRTDISQTFILSGDPTVLANWQVVLAPTDAVASVFGRSGVVTAQTGDYTTAQVTESGNLYHTGARVRATDLTGYSAAGSRTALDASDTLLGAFNKIGKWIGDLTSTAFAAASAAGLAMLTAANAAAQTALLDEFTDTEKGLVPPPGTPSGQFLKDDGTWDTPAGGGGGGLPGANLYHYFTDFMSVTTDDCSNQSAGTGAGISIQAWPIGGNPDASGFMRGHLGTSTTGRCAWYSVSGIALYPRAGDVRFKARGIWTTLSDGTNANYFSEIGMYDTPSGTIAYGLYFRYNHAVNGGRWLAVAENATVETTVDTGVSPNTSAFSVFSIEVDASGNSVDYLIDGVVVATITTNLPAAGVGLGFGIRAVRTAGTASTVAFHFDYMLLEQDFPSRP